MGCIFAIGANGRGEPDDDSVPAEQWFGKVWDNANDGIDIRHSIHNVNRSCGAMKLIIFSFPFE
jgi:hypothetical protein